MKFISCIVVLMPDAISILWQFKFDFYFLRIKYKSVAHAVINCDAIFLIHFLCKKINAGKLEKKKYEIRKYKIKLFGEI